MTGVQTLIARGALGIFAAATGFLAVSTRRFQSTTPRTFNRCAMATFAISRLGIYLLTYVILHLAPRGDIPSYYLLEAQSVLHGQLPYRDFPSSYAPLHPYLDALVLLVWNSPLAIILFAIVAESLLLWVWLQLGRLLFSEQRVRIAAILYLASPISLQFVAIDGQDNVIIALFLALALLLLYRKREAASGILVAAGIVLVKFLPLMYIPAFFLAASRRMRWLIGCTATLLAGYGVFAALRLPLLSPVLAEGHLTGAGNLPYLIESLFNITLPFAVTDGLLVAVFLLVFALIARAISSASLPARLRIVTFSTIALTLTLVLFSKKSWPPYLMLALFPICLSFTERTRPRLRLAAFSLFSVVAVVEHSYWASILLLPDAAAFHHSLFAGEPSAFLLLFLQLLLLGGYIWLLLEAIYQITIANQDASDNLTV
jgi:Dolichyl-phosphate-mannose-protein mannosyltransferase